MSQLLVPAPSCPTLIPCGLLIMLKPKQRGSGWGTHVDPWFIHISVWQKPLQCCKAISLQLIKIIGKKKTQADKSHLVH